MMGAIRRFDRHNQQLLLDDTLEATTARFQIAQQIAAGMPGRAEHAGARGGAFHPTATNLPGAGGLCGGGDHHAL
jgi:hypothetical protein